MPFATRAEAVAMTRDVFQSLAKARTKTNGPKNSVPMLLFMANGAKRSQVAQFVVPKPSSRPYVVHLQVV
jgi:hypothetical protein